MSKIGKKSVLIPAGVEVATENGKIVAKGSKGTLEFVFPSEIEVIVKENEILVEKKAKTKQAQAFWGLTRSIVNNMIFGE